MKTNRCNTENKVYRNQPYFHHTQIPKSALLHYCTIDSYMTPIPVDLSVVVGRAQRVRGGLPVLLAVLAFQLFLHRNHWCRATCNNQSDEANSNQMSFQLCLSSTITPYITLFHQPKYFLIFVSQPQTCATLNTQFITFNIVCQIQTPKSTLLHNCTIDIYMLCNLYTSGSICGSWPCTAGQGRTSCVLAFQLFLHRNHYM